MTWRKQEGIHCCIDCGYLCEVHPKVPLVSFWCLNEPLWLVHHKQFFKKIQTLKFEQVCIIELDFRCASIWTTYLVMNFNFGQRLWDEMWCYWEHLTEHIGNLRNILRTWWELSHKKCINKLLWEMVVLPWGILFPQVKRVAQPRKWLLLRVGDYVRKWSFLGANLLPNSCFEKDCVTLGNALVTKWFRTTCL